MTTDNIAGAAGNATPIHTAPASARRAERAEKNHGHEVKPARLAATVRAAEKSEARRQELLDSQRKTLESATERRRSFPLRELPSNAQPTIDPIFPAIGRHARASKNAEALLDAKSELKENLPETATTTYYVWRPAGAPPTNPDARWVRAEEGTEDDPRWVSAWEAYILAAAEEAAAVDALARTLPTTLAGAFALTDYAARLGAESEWWPAGAWILGDSQASPAATGVTFEVVLFKNIATALRRLLPAAVVDHSDIMHAFAQATPEVRQQALETLRHGQREDGADVHQ